MAFESDVRRQASLLNDSARNARTERGRVNPLVDGAAQWWKGKGAEAFIGEYKSIDSNVNSFLRSIDSAVNNLNRLPSLIARAERERKEEAARKAAEAAAKK